MFHKKEDNILNELDLDTKIYRIFTLDRFKELITSNELVLVNPKMWDDPFENFFLKANAIDGAGNSVDFSNLRQMWYGQCWTKNEDTDAMWRIYSPDKNGVRISTTVKKLFDAIYNENDKFASLKYFIGKVSYGTKDELNDFMNKNSFWNIAIGGQNDGFAKLLCIKREAFEHENEVRILVNENDEEKSKELNGLYKIKIDKNILIDDICLDPRLTKTEYDKNEVEIKKLFNSCPTIFQSDLYQFDLAPIDLN